MPDTSEVPVKPAEGRESTLLTAVGIAAVAVVGLVTIIIILAVPLNNGTQSQPVVYAPSSSAPGGDWRAKLLDLVNQARSQHGAAALCYNDKLNSASQSQSNSGVYGHTWTYISTLNYGYSSLGQNIAMGQQNVQQVFDAWFNEIAPNDGHRQNILNPSFTQMGAGWATGTNMWTQNFGSSSTESCA